MDLLISDWKIRVPVNISGQEMASHWIMQHLVGCASTQFLIILNNSPIPCEVSVVFQNHF